jgi:hypothetical protein
LHTVESAHDVPLERFVFWHPVTELQTSEVQRLPSSQLSAAPAVQMPPWQDSAPLHTLPSAHGVLLATVACVQPPAA